MQATLDPKQLQRFRDPVWRISNLYAIRTRDGKVVPFRPRPQQLQVLQMIYRQGLKADCDPQGPTTWILDALRYHLH